MNTLKHIQVLFYNEDGKEKNDYQLMTAEQLVTHLVDKSTRLPGYKLKCYTLETYPKSIYYITYGDDSCWGPYCIVMFPFGAIEEFGLDILGLFAKPNNDLQQLTK